MYPNSYPQPGYPQSGYRPPVAQGFNLAGLIQRWRAVITGRSVPTFDVQQPAATWQAIWSALAVYGVVSGIMRAIETAITPRITIGGTVISYGSPVANLFGAFVGVFIGFFLAAGVLHLIARMFNGTGTFLRYAYVLSLVVVPLGMASAIIRIVPVLGGLVGLAIGVFEIYLAILATASAHRLPMDRATWVVLIPVLVAIGLALMLFILLASLYIALGFPGL